MVGRYVTKVVDPTDTVEKLSKITNLSMKMRYRAAIIKETGQWLFGDRSGYWKRNDPKLKVVNGF